VVRARKSRQSTPQDAHHVYGILAQYAPPRHHPHSSSAILTNVVNYTHINSIRQAHATKRWVANTFPHFVLTKILTHSYQPPQSLLLKKMKKKEKTPLTQEPSQNTQPA
jgi:hypothetical protein